jgi:hypothetical protein
VEDWDSWKVQCWQWNKLMAANSLHRHLADQHEIYQQTVVAEELLGGRVGVTYPVHMELGGRLVCPVPGCAGELHGGWMLQRHFRDLHPLDRVLILKEEYFPRCERCAMQVNPAYPQHIWTKECQTGVERKQQRKLVVSAALALRRQFTVHGDALERVEVFKYLGCLLAQDNNDAQAVRQQLRKAQSVWARVGQVLHGENTGPRTAAKFYKAVVQAVLLYGSEMWNLTQSALARLEGFHVQAAYKMARKHQPRRGANNVWVYPKLADVLEECKMNTIAEYIQVRRQTIATYVATRPIFKACVESEQRQGSMPRQWWWEQPMCLDTLDAIGSDAGDGHLVASTAADV